MLRERELDCFFYPKSIAVIGASDEAHSIGKQLFENLKNSPFRKKTYPINPFHKKILGATAYKSVKDVPVAVDLAVIAVPAKFTPAVLRECAEKRAKGVVIISSGFGESGQKKLTEEISAIIRKNRNMRVLGPNCFGILMPAVGLNTTFSVKEKMHYPKHGSLSFISQSGALGVTMLDWVSTQNFGIHKFVSYGNAMDVNETHLLEYLGKDKGTKVITAYLEEAKGGRKFLKIAKEVSKKKPIVILKGGVMNETSKAISSHTGSLAGDSLVYSAAFKQVGVIEAKGMRELFAFAKTLEREPLPKGNRVLIITNGGGYGIVTADAMAKNNLKLAELTESSRKKLSKMLPEAASFGNPIDMLGGADEKTYEFAAKTALSDKNVDMVVVLALFNTPTVNKSTVDALVKIKKTAKKPFIVLTFGSKYTEQRRRELEKGGIVTFDYPEIAAKSLEALAGYANYLKKR